MKLVGWKRLIQGVLSFNAKKFVKIEIGINSKIENALQFFTIIKLILIKTIFSYTKSPLQFHKILIF